MSAPASAKPMKTTENHISRDLPALLADHETSVPASARARIPSKPRITGAPHAASPNSKTTFPPRREHDFPRTHASGRLPVALCGVGGRFRVHVVPSVIALRCPFVPSVIISGCPVCRRWSLPGAICAIGGRFRAPVVASLVASGRPLCRWWSLLDALCAVSGRFRAPFWRHNVTEATCNCAQM